MNLKDLYKTLWGNYTEDELLKAARFYQTGWSIKPDGQYDDLASLCIEIVLRQRQQDTAAK